MTTGPTDPLAGDSTSTPPGSPSPTADTDDSVVETLDAALAGEHAAVYAYGVIGAYLTGDDRDRAAAELSRHRAARDRLAAHIRAAGGTPSASLPTYALPYPVADAASAADLADLVEERLGGLYSDVVTSTSGATRSESADALVHTARARAAWSGTATAFPGLDERLTLEP